MLRLYLRFYLTLLGSLTFFAVAAATLWRMLGGTAQMMTRPDHPGRNFHFMLLLLALSIGIVAYPVVRRMSRRLERVQRGVESLGAGDLSARVVVEGDDEVARIANSFNRSASHIEQLVKAHKTLLANASHELRTPLARIRLAVELMKDSVDPKRRAGLESDIAELDWLVGEILLASKLDAVSDALVTQELDLLALAAEECARYDETHLEGEPVTLQGDARLLRRLLRNLLENAARHGRPPTQVRIAHDSDTATILVWDAGPGVPSVEWQNVFQPFYRPRTSLPESPSASAGEASPNSDAVNNTNSRRTGTGLGLSLVRQISRHHGGDVRCTRLDDGRSGFLVTLPLAATPPLNPTLPLAPPQPLTPPPWDLRSKV
jgi:signal transduction histidine kinase